MCCCLESCCCGKTCNFMCWFISCIGSYYTICGSLMCFSLCKETYDERIKRRQEYKELSNKSPPNLEMIDESDFNRYTCNIRLPSPSPSPPPPSLPLSFPPSPPPPSPPQTPNYMSYNFNTNKKIYIQHLKTINE